MKKFIISCMIGFACFQTFSQSILMFVSHEETYYSEYIVMKEALEASGYSVDVRSASSMDFSIYMSPYSDITDVANSLSGSNYAQFQTQFSELFGATWDEAAHDAIPANASVTGSILDVVSIDNYEGLIVVGGTGSLAYRVDGDYSSQGVGGREVSTSDVQASAEKLNELALEALLAGKPVMAQCHGASIPAFWRIPNTSGPGEEALGYSFLKGGISTGFPEAATGPTLTSLDITYREDDRVTISDPHTSLDDNNAAIGKIITTKNWYPQTVAYAARTFLNVLETYPQNYSRTSEVNVLVLHGGTLDESNMPSSCSGGNKGNDVPCNNGTSDADLPADYTHLMELLAGSGAEDDFDINGSELNLSGGSLPFDTVVESEMVSEFENYDVVIFFKHWSTDITDEMQNALVTYADYGGGVISLHHGLYNDITSGQNKDILANQLFGAHSTQSGWSASLTDYDVFSTNYGHFISSYLVDYETSQTDPTAWSTNALPASASSPYSNLQTFEVYDELYNNMAFTGTIDLGREVNQITPLFSNDRNTNTITHTTAFTREVDIDDNGDVGRVAYFEIGERKENINSSSRFGQIVRNAVVWSANKASSMITWNGSSWSNGSGPTMTDDIIITGSYETSEGSLTVNDLTVDVSASISIGDSEFIQVNGDLDHRGNDFTVESGGSLLTFGSISGDDFTFERTTTYDESTGRYSTIGSPIAAADFDLLGSNAVIYGYDETELFNISGNQGEDRFKTPTELGLTEMAVGVGYFSAYTGDETGTVYFSGPPNTGTHQISLSHTDHPSDEDSQEGFNLASNPYPAAISFTSFMAQNNSDIEGAIYIWDDFGSDNARGMETDYLIINGMGNVDSRQSGLTDWDGNIRSMQGFFVQALSTGDLELEFTDNMKVTTNNSDQGYYRTEGLSTLKLALTGAGLYSETLIGMKDDATSSHDQYDARSIAGSALSIFSLISDTKYAIQGIPTSSDAQVGIGVDHLSAGDYVISLNEVDNFAGYSVVLTDTELDITNDLTMSDYSFTYSSGSTIDRFSVRITNSEVVTGIENQIRDWIVYQNESGQIHLNTTTNAVPTRVELISLTGQQVHLPFAQKANRNWIINEPLASGLFILRIHSNEGIRSKKLWLK